MLLAGGSEIATQFFKDSLIDEFWLTMEPIILGSGKPLVSDEVLNIPLKLLSLRKLNTRGTLHGRYKVVKKIRV